MSRRGVLEGIAALAGLMVLPRAFGARAVLPTSSLGKTGRTLPRLGLGCFPLGGLATDEEAVAVLRRAMDLGVRYLDTAPSYADGTSERRVGLALKAWLKDNPAVTRSDFYVATKTLRRDGAGARKEIEASLGRLGLEYVDSVQCHEVHDDWEKLFEAEGVVGAINRAREEKLVRFLGITGHRNRKWVRAAIERMPPKEDGSGIVTALVPVNPVDVQHLSFVREFLPWAKEQGVAVIAMKVFGGGFLLSHEADGKRAYTAGELLRYALAQPAVAVTVPGCDKAEQVAADYDAVAAWTAPDAAWLREMEARAPKHEGQKTEWYKEAKKEPPAGEGGR